MKKQLLLATAISASLICLSAAWTANPARSQPPRDAAREDGDEARKEEKVRELLELTHAREGMEKNLEQMMTAFEEMPMLPEGFADLFVDRFDVDHVIELTVPIYMENLEIETIEAAIAFYQTEEGAKLATALLEIQVQSVAVGQEYGRELGMEVGQELTR